MTIDNAKYENLPEILALQKVAFYAQACLADNFLIRPLMTTISDIERDFQTYRYLIGVEEGRIVASARGMESEGNCFVGNVIVRPDRQGRGLGKAILGAIEASFPRANRFELFTGAASSYNIGFYEKTGYRAFKRQAKSANEPELVFMEKKR
jgi:GNAT superfamily N-acetyltransferase